MKVGGKPTRTLWLDRDGKTVCIIDQRELPQRLKVAKLRNLDDAVDAIASLAVRGAPLVGVTAAFGVALALRSKPSESALEAACTRLSATRPTTVNLRWALEEMRRELEPRPVKEWSAAALRRAREMAEADVTANEAIARQGFSLLRKLWETRHGGSKTPLQILTHCNDGWLGTVDWGTALAPVYWAHQQGLPLHVWVPETRPRNQGAALTAWELGQAGVPHTLVVDTAAGHLMQYGKVDVVLVGTDRATARGDVCNRVGTYLIALAARDNGVPFYAALQSPSIDWSILDGRAEIPIEQRDPAEVLSVRGTLPGGKPGQVAIAPEGTRAVNHGFDVTPARLVTGFITEKGLCAATPEALFKLFPEMNSFRDRTAAAD